MLVLGDAMLDSYLEGYSDRLCREAPVPVVTVTGKQMAPGGAANTATNLACLGASVWFLSVVGEDTEAHVLRRVLERRGVSTEHVLHDTRRRTLSKRRVMSSSQMLVRFDEGSVDRIPRPSEVALVGRLEEMWDELDAVVVSDYAYGVLTPRLVRALGELQERRSRIVVVDSKRLSAYRAGGVTAVKPNYTEAVRLLGEPEFDRGGPRVRQIAAEGRRVLDTTGARIGAVTLDIDGALVFEREREAYRTYAQPRPDSCAAGAGDTFLSALTLALAAGADTPEAAEVASAAAAVVVSREGTTTCSEGELLSYLHKDDKRVTDLETLASSVAHYRQSGGRLVFTNGCFDILHSGHIQYLNQAKSLGDVLIVGVNSDTGVGRLKGFDRPINNLEDRAHVLSALSCVDHVVPFEGETPAELIRLIRPDVFVKGGDYTWETLPEAPLVEALGGEVHILPYVSERSTSGMIDRIRRLPEMPVGGSTGGGRR